MDQRKTRFWIEPVGEQGHRHNYRIGDVRFHHYAFQFRSRKDVDALHDFMHELATTVVDIAGEYYSDDAVSFLIQVGRSWKA